MNIPNLKNLILTMVICGISSVYANNTMIAHNQKITSTTATTSSVFGDDVDVDGDWMIVGGSGHSTNQGKIYFYEKQTDGTWSEDSNFTPSGLSSGTYFGLSVSISGDYAVAGAVHANSSQGEVYVYYNDPSTGWGEFQTLTDSTGAANHYFGFHAAISGDRIVTGAYGNDDNKTDGGAVFVFKHDGTDFQLEEEIYPTGSYSESGFGYYVGIDGTRLVASAPDFLNNTEGAIYIFDYDSTTGWEQTAKFTPSDSQGNGARFGYAVSIDGDTVVSSLFAAYNSSRTGRVYVFTLQQDGSWLEEAILLSNQYAYGDAFGTLGLDANDGLIAVGSYQKTYPSVEKGEGYVFARNEAGFWQQVFVTRTDRDNYDRFGNSASISGRTVVFGALGDDDQGTDAGAVYHYELPSNAAESQLTGPNAPAWRKVTNSGDVEVVTEFSVGIGTDNPDAELHIYSNASATTEPRILIEKDTTTLNDTTMLVMENYGGSKIQMIDNARNNTWQISTPTNHDSLIFTRPGTGGSEMSLSDNGDLEVRYSITAGTSFFGEDLGLGTTTLSERVHVYSTNNDSNILLENADTTASDAGMLTLKNYGGAVIKFNNTNLTKNWTISNPNSGSELDFNFDGTSGSEMTLSESGDLDVLNDITAGGTVTWSSDRNIKENFKPINHHDVLDKIANMEISQWNYIADEDDTPHIGPMAQDFYAAFGVGQDEKHISSTDINGVAFASIKALNEKLDAKDAKIAELETKLQKMDVLEQKLSKLEALLLRLED